MKGLLFQQVQVLSRQRSFQPGSYASGYGGNEVAEAWGKETASGRLMKNLFFVEFTAKELTMVLKDSIGKRTVRIKGSRILPTAAPGSR